MPIDLCGPEDECRRAVNAVGLEPSVGFLHEFSSHQTKQSLVYDLQEPFRWIADVAVMEAFESGVLDLPDFYFTGDDYRYRFEPEAKQRFLDLLRERFNSGVRYKGRVLKWDTVIEQKTIELSFFMARKSNTMGFEEPAPTLERQDNNKLRTKIQRLTQSDGKRIGIGKSTLHYLRRKARNERPFTVYRKVIRRMGLLQ
jgi:CRISPR-associated protein Cas1